jgi:hypothetical protein
VDHGSKDRTAKVGRRFASKGVTVQSTENRRLSAAVNRVYRLCQGDYIRQGIIDCVRKRCSWDVVAQTTLSVSASLLRVPSPELLPKHNASAGSF